MYEMHGIGEISCTFPVYRIDGELFHLTQLCVKFHKSDISSTFPRPVHYNINNIHS